LSREISSSVIYALHIVNHTALVGFPQVDGSGGPAAGPVGCFTKPATLECVTRANHTSEEATRPGWTFLTNHGHVLVCIAGDPGIRARDIATRVGITERAAQAIIADLVRDGYVKRTRIGRRNHYDIDPDRPLRHPVEQPHTAGELLQLVSGLAPSPRRKASAS